MSETQLYKAVATLAGQAKIAAAIANAGTINITAVAAGDGNGAPIIPLVTMTGLIHEVWRGAPLSVSRDPAQPTQVLVEVLIPESAAPATIRELALYTDDGQCIVIANHPAITLATVSEGAANNLRVLIPIVVDTAANVTIVVNPETLVPIGRMLRAPFIAIDSFSNAPPANPLPGALTVVGPAPTGAYANRAHQFSQWTGVLWQFAPAPVDTIVGNAADHRYYRRTAIGWKLLALGDVAVASGEGVAIGEGFPSPVNLAYPSLHAGIPLNPDLFSFFSVADGHHLNITWENLLALIMTAVNHTVGVPAPVASNFAANGFNGFETTVALSSHISGGFTSVAIVDAGASGAIVSGGAVIVPAALAVGVYSITYRATGPGGNSNTATLTFTQAAYVAAPVAADFVSSGVNGVATSIPLPAHIMGAFTSVALVSAGGTGAALAGTSIEIPSGLAVGVYALTYRATGPGGNSNTATITFTQSAFVAAPVASSFTANGISGTATNIPLPSHIAGGFTSVEIVSAGGSGAALSGTSVVVPAGTAIGTYAITYRATGPGGVSNTATITFNQAAAYGVGYSFTTTGWFRSVLQDGQLATNQGVVDIMAGVSSGGFVTLTGVNSGVSFVSDPIAVPVNGATWITAALAPIYIPNDDNAQFSIRLTRTA